MSYITLDRHINVVSLLFSYGISLFLIVAAGFNTETERITRQGKTLIFSNTDPKLDRDVKEKLIETFFEVYPKMKRDFNLKAPDTIRVKVDTSYGGVAYASDGEIVISSEWLHKKPNDIPKTIFQTAAPWNAAYDIRSDAVMVYGARNNFKQRMQSWEDRGYHLQFMTGMAWGDYQDYFLGKVDGENHLHEGQMERDGDRIMHGENVPYTVPTDAYLDYMKSLVKKVIDAGITTIYLEEPEFWARAGYSDIFKKKWEEYYGYNWMPQHESPEATYLSSRLKYQLYYDALEEVFKYAKEYGKSKGKEIKCFVPTHSLINYSSWQIVSPEASLASLDAMDGYIAQVWTGTSREPVYYNGESKERVFENAFLEYGSMLSMIKPTGREIYFLTDPIEDRSQTWDDYKRNYQATFIAQLLYPSVDKFEVMPWPRRIYTGAFETKDSDEEQPMPESYATQVQVMINALNEVPVSENKVSGSSGIGALVSNSMMFQRFPTHDDYEDPQLSNFYGMVMPLLKRGVPVETVHMENLSYPQALANIKVLVMSYANMKPMQPDVHKHLANWIKQGGVLLYYGRDQDPFQDVREWWNNDGQNDKKPSDDLFSRLEIEETNPIGKYSYGDGKVIITRKDPKELVMQPKADKAFVDLVKQNYEQSTDTDQLITKNSFFLQRGPYDIISVMDESVSNGSFHVEGPVIDLFDPKIPVLEEKIVRPGEQAFLYNLNRVKKDSAPRVLVAASRVSAETKNEHSYSLIAKSPSNTLNAMRILLPKEPKDVEVLDHNRNNVSEAKYCWDAFSKTIFLEFGNSAEGHQVHIEW